MDMIEVDPELFVKCRLCLVDTGMYQIVPIIQMQMKFCFDIEINLFDGLPQLICKKCKCILSDYFTTKTNFIEKQQTLKTKFGARCETASESCDPPQLGTVSSSQEENDEIKGVSKSKRRRTYLISSSATSDDANCKNSLSPIIGKKKLTNCTKPSPAAWEAYYRKKFVCVMCQKRFRKKSSLQRHFAKHGNLVSRYENVFKTYCTVDLNKTDEQPNMTGVSTTVVYSQDKIISNEGKTNFFVLYTSKRKHKSDGSSDDCMFTRHQHKKSRKLSRSSNETIVLEGEKNRSLISSDDEEKFREAEANDTECINIDDSSDTASCKSTKVLNRKADKTIRANVNELKQIYNISSVCYSKYLKRKESENCLPSRYSGSTESQLKHKILNMGRKVITKQGFNCTGLLRFVENKILEIIWIPTHSSTCVNVNKETNYVRIMAKLRGKEQYLTDNLGWKFITETCEDNSEQENSKAPDDNISVIQMNPIRDTVNIIPPAESCSGPLDGHLNENNSLLLGHIKNENQTLKAVDQAVIYTMNADIDTSLKNKLLNASPVANPKQLPKKSATTDSKLGTKSDGIVLQTTKQTDLQNNEFCVYLDEDGNADSNLCIPIIMSTTSLAFPSSNGKEQYDNYNKDAISNINVTSDSEKCPPRIKVKPVSELMSERVLKNLSQQQTTAPSNIWGQNQNTINHVYATNVGLPSQAAPLKTLEIVPMPSSNIAATTAQVGLAPQTVDREYVILDTAELPNTKTDSPFKYFKNLLNIHNIILLDTHENVPRDFVCLIKFKLQYKQDAVDKPVVLYLYLLSAENQFYIAVKYSVQENNIDWNKLPANWQWEILNKIYQDEVVNKVLKNAEKVSQTMYENTNNFLCLLKSIKFKKVI